MSSTFTTGRRARRVRGTVLAATAIVFATTGAAWVTGAPAHAEDTSVQMPPCPVTQPLCWHIWDIAGDSAGSSSAGSVESLLPSLLGGTGSSHTASTPAPAPAPKDDVIISAAQWGNLTEDLPAWVFAPVGVPDEFANDPCFQGYPNDDTAGAPTNPYCPGGPLYPQPTVPRNLWNNWDGGLGIQGSLIK